MGYAIFVDWQESYDDWENEGQRVMEQSCNHKDDEGQEENNIREKGYCDECAVTEDSQEPMMNYAYPLETAPSDKKIREVCERTNLTVMYHIEECKYYLALTGGGMDLSQDIALAYRISETIIPFDLCVNVNAQKGLSQGGDNFDEMAQAVIDSLNNYIGWAENKKKELRKSMKGDKNDKR